VNQSRLIWLIALGLSLLVGTVLALRYPTPLPRHLGYYVGTGALLAGIVFGLRGAALPILGSLAFGLVRLFARHHTGDEGVQGFIGLFGLLIPLVVGGIALVGALMRTGLLTLIARVGRHGLNDEP
jgi:hypothetical protein